MKKKILLIAILLTIVTGCGDNKNKETKKEETQPTTKEVVTTEPSTTTSTTVVVSDPTTKVTTTKTTKATKAPQAKTTTQATTTTVKTTKACDLKFNSKCYKIGDTITIEFTATSENVEDFRIRTYVNGKGAGSYDTLDVLNVENSYVSSGTTSDPTDNGYEGFVWIRMNGESIANGKKVYTLKYKVTNTGEYTLKYNVDSATDREGNDIDPSTIKISASVK